MAVTARASSDRMRAPGLPIVPEHEETVPYTQTAFCVRLFSSRKCRGRASGSRPVCTTGAINTYILKVLRCRLRLDSSAICTRSLVQQALQRCQLHTPSWNYAPAMREHWQNKGRDLASGSLCSASFHICSLLLLPFLVSGRSEQN